MGILRNGAAQTSAQVGLWGHAFQIENFGFIDSSKDFSNFMLL